MKFYILAFLTPILFRGELSICCSGVNLVANRYDSEWPTDTFWIRWRSEECGSGR